MHIHRTHLSTLTAKEVYTLKGLLTHLCARWCGMRKMKYTQSLHRGNSTTTINMEGHLPPHPTPHPRPRFLARIRCNVDLTLRLLSAVWLNGTLQGPTLTHTQKIKLTQVHECGMTMKKTTYLNRHTAQINYNPL